MCLLETLSGPYFQVLQSNLIEFVEDFPKNRMDLKINSFACKSMKNDEILKNFLKWIFPFFVVMYKQFDQMDFKQVEFVGRTYYHIIFCWIRFTHERRLIKWSNCLCYRSNAIHNASTWIILCWQNTWTLCCNDGENGTYHLLLSCMKDKQIHSCSVMLYLIAL